MLIERVLRLRQRIDPVQGTFIVSLLLSWIAIQGRLLNRDGIYYLDTARTILEEGVGAVMRAGEWNFLPLLIATVSNMTPLGVENAAKTLNALLMAGTCALVVACVRRRTPALAWYAALVVLAMPAFNQYRHEILREYGFWFFSMLAFWLMMRWADGGRRRENFLGQAALLVAALFRLEAVAFFAALALWRAFAAQPGQRIRDVLTITALPIILALLAMLAFSSGIVTPPHRLIDYLNAANPWHKLPLFAAASERLSDLVLNTKYSREEAVYILIVGLLAIIPLKFLKMMGLLVIPFIHAFMAKSWRKLLEGWQPLPWAFAIYILVLVAFVTHKMFLVGRYVSMLNLLVVPLVTVGFMQLAARIPRWNALMVGLACLTAVANVVSLAPRQTHILEAGAWLKENVGKTQRVGLENGRLAYYAGWKLSRATVGERNTLTEALANHHLDLAALEVARNEGLDDAWLARHGLTEIQRYAGPKDRMIIIVSPALP